MQGRTLQPLQREGFRLQGRSQRPRAHCPAVPSVEWSPAWGSGTPSCSSHWKRGMTQRVDEKGASLGSYAWTSGRSEFKGKVNNSVGEATMGPGIRPPLAKALTTGPRRPTPVQGNHAGSAPEEMAWGLTLHLTHQEEMQTKPRRVKISATDFRHQVAPSWGLPTELHLWPLALDPKPDLLIPNHSLFLRPLYTFHTCPLPPSSKLTLAEPTQMSCPQHRHLPYAWNHDE